MKVILTKSFLSKYKKIIWLVDLDKVIWKIKVIKLVNLKYPYLKLKLIIWWIAIRWVLIKTKWWNLIFIILCFKKDKKCWNNLSFENSHREIVNMEIKVLKDIENGDYTTY